MSGAGFKDMYEHICQLINESTKEKLVATYLILNMHFNDFGNKGTVLTPESENSFYRDGLPEQDH